MAPNYISQDIYFLFSFENIEFREKLNEFLLTEDAEWNLLDILDREVEEVKERSSEARFRRDMKQRSMPTGAEKEQCQIEMMKVRISVFHTKNWEEMGGGEEEEEVGRGRNR